METVKELAKILEECDCKHSAEHCDMCPYIGEDGCLSYFETAKKLVEHGVTIAIDTNDGDKWVSVDERLPDESLNSVLGWDEYRGRCVFVQYYKGEWILGDHESVKVTHWMPFPQPPKEVE